MNRWEFLITNDRRREAVRVATEAIWNCANGTLMVFDEPSKSRIQENKYHAMIGDIARQCVMGGRKFNQMSWKRILVTAFVNVLREDAQARGDADPFPGETELIEGIDGELVALGPQTRNFTKEQASDFIEYLFYFGADRTPPVVWSEPAQRVIKAMLDRKTKQG